MKAQYDPAKVAEHEAARWQAIDQGNVDACYMAHIKYLQEHFGLSPNVAEELTNIRMQAGAARVNHRKAVAELTKPETISPSRHEELEKIIINSEQVVIRHLTKYYTRLQEEIQK